MTSPKTRLSIRFFVACMYCLIGCATMWVLLGLEGDAANQSEMPVFVICAGFGAFAAGALFAPMIGRDKTRSWVAGGLGAIFATLVGAGVGGMAMAVFTEWPLFWSDVPGFLILVPQMGIVAMAIVVIAMFLSLAGPIWLALMVLTHVITRRLRRRFPTIVEASVFD